MMDIFKYRILLLLVFSFAFISCQKREEQNLSKDNNSAKLEIVNQWKKFSNKEVRDYVDGWRESNKELKPTKIDTSLIPKEGFVPDEETAIKIAEILWLKIYGKDIYFNKPFIAVLLEDNVWHVTGTLPPGYIGGSPEAEIQKSDGRIIFISHGK